MAFPVTLNGRTYTLTDFEGTNYVDGLPDAFEDFVTHAGDIYNSTSTTSNSIGTGSKTFTVEANKPYQAGTPLRIADAAAPSTNFLDTVVTSYSGTTLVVNSIGYGGSGTKTSWTVNIGGAKTVDGTLGLSQGGTGATDAAGARTNIDVYSKADADSRFLNVSGEASDVTMNGNTTIGDSSTDTLTVRATTTFTNIGTGAAAGPYVNLFRDSSSPADDDFIGILSWQGKNDADQIVTYGQIAGRIADASDGSEDARIDLQAIVAGTTRSIMQYESGLTQFNAAGQDIDFKVHSTNHTDMFFLDANLSRIGIKTSSLTQELNIDGNFGFSEGSWIGHTDGSARIAFRDDNLGVTGNSMQIASSNDIVVATMSNAAGSGNIYFGSKALDPSEAGWQTNIFFGTEGSAIFNESNVGSADFRVEGDALTHALFVDATNSYVGVGESVPAAPLHVSTTAQNTALFDSSHTSGTQFFIRNSNASVDSSAMLGFAPANDISGVTITAIAEEDFSTAANRTARLEIETRDNGNFYDRLTLSRAEAVFNDDSDGTSFRVESNDQTHMFFVDSGENAVLMGLATAASGGFNSTTKFVMNGTSSYVLGLRSTNSTSTGLALVNFRDGDDQQMGQITGNASANTVTYGTSSDRSLKENDRPIPNPVDRVKSLNPVLFDWISDGTSSEGFIAQELEQDTQLGIDTVAGEDGEKNVDYGRLTPLLTAALQEALAKIETLEARIAALESN